MRKIAIITASIGAGHNQVAKYLKESLHDVMPLGDYVIYDMLDEKKLYSLAKNVYLGVLEKAPNIYSKAYRWTQKQQNGKSLINIYNYLSLKFLKTIQKSFNPHSFIFTHPFPTTAYRSSHLSPAWSVITDYGYHPAWYNPEITGYFAPNEQVMNHLIENGYPKKSIHLTGIPVSKKFIAAKTERVHKSYLQAVETPKILIMGGGLGIGCLVETINILKDIKTPFTSTVMTGQNSALHHFLQNTLINDKRWEVIGHTNCVEKYMKNASLLITKAGAVTMAEAAICGLPLVIYRPLPGHEEENANYFCRNKAAIWAKNSKDLVNKTSLLLSDTKLQENMSMYAKGISRPYASRAVAIEVIYQLLTHSQGEPYESIK